MDECFRFLINVDQCLNMSMYDIFFYKLKNDLKFRLNQLQDSSEAAFVEAFQDIHMYLNKFPYHFKEYQIIITMRSPQESKESNWENCLLHRLLQLNQSLHDANLCMDSGPSADSALNLFLFHEAEVHHDKKALKSYLDSERLVGDCRLLLEYMAAYGNASAENARLTPILNEYQKKHPEDLAVIKVLKRFHNSRTGSTEELVSKLADFFRKLFVNFNVIDLQQARHLHHAPRMNIGEMLRVVEYITASMEHTPQSLGSRCLVLWNSVKDQDLEIKYSDMLFVYEQMLKHAHEQLELNPLPVDRKKTKLPEDFYKKADGIGTPDSAFQKEKVTEPVMLTALADFLKVKHQPKTIRKAWEDAYSVMEQALPRMEPDLRSYAIDMGHIYTRRVEKRKKEALHWKGKRFFADENTLRKIAAEEKRLECYLNALRKPDLIPSLEFEKHAEAKAALTRANAQIQYYLDCLDINNRTNFAKLSLGAFLLTLQHYIWLQPFSFANCVSIQAVVVTLAIMLISMGLAGILPGVYYRKAIMNCARELKEELDKCVPEYHSRAEKFREYINTLDQLDRTGKLITIYRDQLAHTRRLERGCMWHKTRIQEHLIKLGAFRSLIDSGNGRSRTCTFDEKNCPTSELLTVRELNDIEQCCLYWPQGR